MSFFEASVWMLFVSGPLLLYLICWVRDKLKHDAIIERRLREWN